MQKIVGGACVAILLASVMSGTAIGGVAVWKILLAAIGLILFTVGGRKSQKHR